jgi:hypothetical protein
VLPDAKPVRVASLLKAGTPLAFRQAGRTIDFVVPSLADYEVVALEV